MDDTAANRLVTSLGRYDIVRKLGEGGMAEVFLARHAGPAGFTKDVVIKRVRPELVHHERARKMFLREAMVAARLNHANVVQVFELFEEAGELFLVMEYLDGLSWRDAARRSWAASQPMPMEVVAGAIAQAALGLAHAHALEDDDGKPAPLVHRDISPDNLMLTRDGVTKVLDFGIAKMPGAEHLTRTEEIKGKLPYMSPEQIRGEELDPRSDLWSLGVTLFWMLTGQRPLRARNDPMQIFNILHEEPPPPSSLNPEVPRALEELVLALLEKRPEDRPESGVVVYESLQSLLGTLPIASRASTWAREALALPDPEDTVYLPRPASRAPEEWRDDTVPLVAAPVSPLADTAIVRATQVLAPPQPNDDGAEAEGFHEPETRTVPSLPRHGATPMTTELPEATLPMEAALLADDVTATRKAAPSPAREIAPRRARTPLVAALLACGLLAGLLVAWLARRDVPSEVTPSIAAANARAAETPRNDAPAAVEEPPFVEEAVVEELAVEDGDVDEGASAAPPPEEPPAEEVGSRAPERNAQPRARAQRAPRVHVVTTTAPRSVRWTLSKGSPRLGVGGGELRVPRGTRELHAYDPTTSGHHVVPIRDRRADFEGLGQGTVDVRVLPWGEVALGKRALGTTPLAPVTLKEGEYVLTVRVRERVERVPFRVRAGEKTPLRVDLR